MDPELSPRQNLLIDPCLGEIPGEQNLLIVPCYGEIPGVEMACLQIFVVPLTDLGRSGSGCPEELRPKFLVDRSKFGREFCLVGSRIYMFDSDSKPDSAVGAFQLSRYLNDDDMVEFKEDMMCDMAPMSHKKRWVKAVPTPGGKILAFSIRIEESRRPNFFWLGINNNNNNQVAVVDFELYDPQTDCWQDLPPIYQDGACHDSFAISSYTFLDDTAFAIETDTGGQFCLILEGPHGSYWVDHFYLGGTLPLCGFSRAPIGGGDQLWLTPNTVCDIKGGLKKVSRFPFSAFPRPALQPAPQSDHAFEYHQRTQSIVFEETSSCCFLLEIAKRGDHFLQIDQYHLDMVKYFQDKVKYEENLSKEPHSRAPQLERPQLERRLLSSTKFRLSAGRLLPMLAKTPIIIQPAHDGLA